MNKSNVFVQEYIPSAYVRIWRNFHSNRLAMIAFWVFLFFVMLACFGPMLTIHPINQTSSFLLVPPSWDDFGRMDHFFGTDALGRDILSRLIYGTRYTFGGALSVTLIALLIGVPLGILAGMTRGFKSSFLHHLMDTTLSIPSLLIALLLVSLMGMGFETTLIAITLAQIPKFLCSIHNVVIAQMQKEYILAIKLDGASHYRILKYGILPNILDSIISQTTRALSSAILDIAALGFIGIGAQAPIPEWGAMLNDKLDLLHHAPWTVTLPGLAIIICILSINILGEGLRNALNEGIE